MTGIKGCLLVPIMTILISKISGDVEISFMKGAPRLNNSIYCDYYFACHAEGEILQWIINSTNISEYFGQSNIGQVFNGSILNCNVITTLLLLKPLPLGQSIFGSTLIISCQSSVNFNFGVVCTNGSISKMTSNTVKELSTVTGTNISTVILEHVLTENLVVADIFSCTSIYLCGVDNSFMTWQVQGNDKLGFSIFDNIGLERRRLQGTTLKQQAILIGKTPYMLVVALFVIDNAIVNVTCGYRQINVSLMSMQCSNRETLSTMETAGENLTAENTDGNDIAEILGTIFGIVALAFIIFSIVIIIIFLYYCCWTKRRNRHFDSHDGPIDQEEKPLKDNNFRGIKKVKKRKNNIDFYEAFFQRIQYIFLTRNQNTFNAALTFMTAPEIESRSNEITAIHENVYIGMIENIPVCLVDGTEENFLENLKNIIIKHICNAKYLIFLGRCFATNREKTKLADILIPHCISHTFCEGHNMKTRFHSISPEMRTKFCFYPEQVKGLKVAKGRYARHSVALMASGRNILNNQNIQDFALTKKSIDAFEETGGDLMRLYNNGVDMGNNTTKTIHVIIIGAVTSYVNSESYNDEWEFIASQAAFHYVASKIKYQDVSSTISYEIKKAIPMRNTFDCDDFCGQVEYLISMASGDEFDAASTIITAPENEESIVKINDSAYIGMIGSHPVGMLCLTNTLTHFDDIENAVDNYFTNVKYVFNVGGCIALDRSKANLGDVLISRKIHHIAYDGRGYKQSINIMGSKSSDFIFNTFNVEDFILPGNRRAKYLAVRIASGSGVNIEKDKDMKDLAVSSQENYAYEEAGGDLLRLQEKMMTKGKLIEVFIINGVTCYEDSTQYSEWHFVASQAAFHYLCCKMKQL